MPFRRFEQLLPWLGERHRRLPKWAQREISDLRGASVNADMGACVDAEVRRMAKRVLGMNCTFSDDDLRLLTVLAERAIDADLHRDFGPEFITKIDLASQRRREKGDEEL
jgi:hypothetical protein